MNKPIPSLHVFTSLIIPILLSCQPKETGPSQASIDDIQLKRGELISCNTFGSKLGTVQFDVSCSDLVKPDFNHAMQLLHSFEYVEAEKVFAKIIDRESSCAMAYWGVAMCNFHPLWTPPTEDELTKGSKALAIAKSMKEVTSREAQYIQAIDAYYADWKTQPHATRAEHFKDAMAALHTAYPEDFEAATFYALSLDAAASPTDTTFQNQRKAGEILNTIYPGEPDHPGVIHYIIHTYDYPGLAQQGLEAARKYANVAPASSHAQHMPSHIFTRLGYWGESIESNLNSIESSKCYAEAAGIKGHWDEEFHALDYLVYAYLQQGENLKAKTALDDLNTMKDIFPINFKVAYSIAAIPARYVLENKLWKEASELSFHNEVIAWDNFPWQSAIHHFARLLGSVHVGKLDAARLELVSLHELQDTLTQMKDAYKANQVFIQIQTGEAWIKFKEGKTDEALKLMTAAAVMEDHTQKHPVTPSEVLPARELLGDLLMAMHKPAEALKAYEADLKTHPNRFNGLYQAGVAAEKSGDTQKAMQYFKQLIEVAGHSGDQRPELHLARLFLDNKVEL